MRDFESMPSVKIEAEQKQEIWDKKVKQIKEVEDRLGCPVDEGIKEAVIAFWVNNFPTQMSCEGHVEVEDSEIRKNSPYIIVGFDNPKKIYEGQESIEEEIAKSMKMSLEEAKRRVDFAVALDKYVNENNILETPECIEVTKNNEELKKQIVELLRFFYKDREVLPGNRLNIAPLEVGSFAVISKKEEPDNEEELKAQQKEMQDFAEFLKKKFFAS